MTKFEVGDRVKVAYEGTVSWAGGSGVDVEYSGGFSWADNDIVTLVERRKPKVGDTVAHLELDGLPVGTVIVHKGANDGALVKRPDGRWFNAKYEADHDSGGLSMPREIIYLPD